jgi:hypothetical protein
MYLVCLCRVSVHAGNAPLIPAYLLSLFTQVPTAVVAGTYDCTERVQCEGHAVIMKNLYLQGKRLPEFSAIVELPAKKEDWV